MKRALVIAKKKDHYAPIVDAIQRTGLPVLDFSDDLMGFDQLIVFHNKYFEPLNTDAKVGWWMCDFRKPHELVAAPQKNCDHIFLPYGNYHQWYSDHFGVPVTFMPQCGVEWPNVPNPRKMDCDVVFIGNVADGSQYHGNRSAIINAISTFYKVDVIGGERNTRDMREILQQAPIALNITPPGMAGCSNRLYNVLSSGGLCLTTWFEGIEELFVNGEHLVWFRGAEDATQAVSEILRNPRMMQGIRTSGRLLYREKHTARIRMHNMFDILSGEETKFRGFL